jgi:hypothetical protein
LGGRVSLSGLDWCGLARRDGLNWLCALVWLGVLGWTLQVLSGLMEFFVKFLTGLPELVHALTKTPRQLWKLLCAEENKNDNQN